MRYVKSAMSNGHSNIILVRSVRHFNNLIRTKYPSYTVSGKELKDAIAFTFSSLEHNTHYESIFIYMPNELNNTDSIDRHVSSISAESIHLVIDEIENTIYSLNFDKTGLHNQDNGKLKNSGIVEVMIK